MTTGERISERRKELGISADALAAKIGVSRTTVFRYESGYIKKLPMNSLVLIARTLSTTASYLMGLDESSLSGGNASISSDFPDRLDLLMQERGLNKHSLSEKSGVPYSTIDNFRKKGWVNAKLETLRKLAVFFECSIDHLLYGDIRSVPREEGFRERVSSEEDEKKLNAVSSDRQENLFVQLFESLPSERQQEAIRYLYYLRHLAITGSSGTL